MKKILLHICCGVCAGSVVEKLRGDGFKVIGFFYNPNIYPWDEYERRLAVAKEASRLLDFELIEGTYDDDRWFTAVEGLENEKEGGRRCQVCFRVRLQRTAQTAKELGIEYMASTLSVSPHKNVQEINRIGQELSSCFLPYDFKKEEGFNKTMKFAKEHQFYRQNYCGCEFSRE